MIEEQPDGVELSFCKPVDVPRDVVSIEAKRRSGSILAAVPIYSLDIEDDIVGVQHAVSAFESHRARTAFGIVKRRKHWLWGW